MFVLFLKLVSFYFQQTTGLFYVYFTKFEELPTFIGN